MTSVKFSYEISSLPNGLVDSDVLTSTIRASNISTQLDFLSTHDGFCDVWMKDALADADMTTLNGIVLSHTGAQNIQSVIAAKINAAMDFGKKMMIEYGTKNVLRGYTVAQTREVSFKLSELQSLLLSGSLYCARQAAIDMAPDALVTQADKDELLAKLNSYLGIPS